ncbi:hypothetical protein JCM10450v2_001088 [Rhodotorula kratochvilovae]
MHRRLPTELIKLILSVTLSTVGPGGPTKAEHFDREDLLRALCLTSRCFRALSLEVVSSPALFLDTTVGRWLHKPREVRDRLRERRTFAEAQGWVLNTLVVHGKRKLFPLRKLYLLEVTGLSVQGAFTGLTHLTIENCTEKVLPEKLTKENFPVLETLVLSLSPSSAAIARYSTFGDATPPDTVRARCLKGSYHPMFCDLLASPHLEHLHLNLPIQHLPWLLSDVTRSLRSFTIEKMQPGPTTAGIQDDRIARAAWRGRDPVARTVTATCLQSLETLTMLGIDRSAEIDEMHDRIADGVVEGLKKAGKEVDLKEIKLKHWGWRPEDWNPLEGKDLDILETSFVRPKYTPPVSGGTKSKAKKT